MKRLWLRFFALIILVESSSADSVLMDGVAAYVNEDAITVGDVIAALEPVRRQLVRLYAGEELLSRMRKAYDDALNAMIEKRLVVSAYNNQQMRLPEWVIDERINDIISEMFGGDRAALMQALAEDHMSYEEWRRTIQDQMAASSMRSAHVEQLVAVPPGDVRRYYERNADRFKSPARVHLRMIVLQKRPGEDRRPEAESLLKRLRSGEDFAAVARSVSDGDKAEEGGDWGWMEPSILRSELVEAVGRIKTGEVGEIVETGDELYLLKIEGRQEESTAPFSEAREEIERDLRREAIEAAYTAWIERLKAEAYVKILDVDVFK